MHPLRPSHPSYLNKHVLQVQNVEGKSSKSVKNTSQIKQRRIKAKNGIQKGFRKQIHKEKLKNLKLGQKIKGEVVSIKPFGVFVRLNYKYKIDALLHKSQISNSFVENVGDHFEIGQPVEARITRIDYEKCEVGISTRRKRPDRYPIQEFRDMVGREVEGRVKSIMEYGAFIDIGCKNTDALLHISRISDEKVERIEDFVNVGDVISVRLVKVIPNEKVIQVSMRSEESDRYHDKKRAAKEKWALIAEDVASL